ncbi:glycosyl transferase [Paenibacillus barcinonensis]|uniref:Glycosyl transferase n=1 Tax=Paenibacillus barcinonensis TaxID=198119 RepID=A0A2V4VTJ3_PAEBA|nr:macrolide family glycosyltransferase [Paenibacillus barcinonensis]PYE48070.1 MGT family glycosyltransferase [Paenibacillus barcinonensis]QKS55179.1 glycosyl transferase [Paenibacillus barcinonensis]
MARVLVVITPAEGHVNPSLGLITELVNLGEEVVYVTVEEYRSRMEQTGARVMTYPFLQDAFSHDPVLKPLEYRHPYQFIHMVTCGVIPQMIPEVLRVIEHQTFDYLIYDSLMGWGGKILAEKLGIPAVCSITSFAFVEPLGKNVGSLNEEHSYTQQLYEAIMNAAQEIAAEYQVSVPAVEDIMAHTGQLKIVYTSRYFQPRADELDDRYLFTGPSIIPRQDAPAFPFRLLRERHSETVYISMGTILNKNLEFYKLCFDALKDLPINVVLSSGKYTDLEALEGLIPDNFIVKPYVAQLEILQHTNVFVTHAGMNSVSEALYFDVPLVMIPMTSDQPFVAARVNELGAGVVLDQHHLSAALLREAVMEVLHNPDYQKQAHLIGESLRQAGGYTRAAAAIMQQFAKV